MEGAATGKGLQERDRQGKGSVPGGDSQLLQAGQLGSVTTFRHGNESKVEAHHFCLVRAWDIGWSIVAEPIRVKKTIRSPLHA